MPSDRLTQALEARLDELAATGRLKGDETVIRAVIPPDPASGRGPRFLVEGRETPFLRMNSNNYLGMACRAEVVAAEESGAEALGAGPGAVRFISGSFSSHVMLERRLSRFHDRDAAILFSSAYAAMIGILPQLTTESTAIVSDALNHNCIITAISLARPAQKLVYRHCDMRDLESSLKIAADGGCKRALVVTDGIFSMRGDWAPLDEIVALARSFDGAFPENVVVVVDDSHGVGAFGRSGRGTEEHTVAPQVDILVGTLGKAFGVNGGYVVANRSIVAYLRETAATYVYSNPITPGEAEAASQAIDMLDSPVGLHLLAHLREQTARFKLGLTQLGFETLPGEHPVVPLFTRDTSRTIALIAYLREHGVLATGLAFPVVPKGEEEIRFQISADHTADDIDAVLEVLGEFARAKS
jgi:glycine C-acetyltransferase